MDWSALHSRLRAVPEPAWPLGASSALALVFQVWWIPVLIAALVGLSFCVQRGTRRRARQLHAEVAATGGGVWLGRMPIEEASALWGKSLPVLLAFPYFDIGYPVKLVADANGLALHSRGLLPWLAHLTPALIPWADQAGARQHHLGLNTESRALWVVPLTRVTVDLIGPSAAGHLAPMSEEEMEQALQKLGIDPDTLDEDDADPETEDPDEDAQNEAFWRESYGPDWRRGTEPLHFTTSEPDGLVDLVLLRHLGRPASTVLP